MHARKRLPSRPWVRSHLVDQKITLLPKAGLLPQSGRKIGVSRLLAELLLQPSAKEAGPLQKPSSLLRRALMPAISELPGVQG